MRGEGEMTSNAENRRRAFAEVVAIDAWHDGFSKTVSTVDLHVDVVFGTGRIGAEAESPVRFRLSVRQADVVVIIPDTEPVGVEKKSVSRDAPALRGKVTDTIERSAKGKAKGRIAASISTTALRGAGAAELEAESAVAQTKKIEVVGTIQFIAVTQSKTADGHYRWSLKPTSVSSLEGRPWDAEKQPRLKLVDKRKDRSKGIPPAVRVEVRCRREDLVIEDLEMKDETRWEELKRRTGIKNNVAAAESYIRDRLLEEGLEVGNIGELFGQLTLGSVTAEPQES
jgi:hypothetical protein